jgi:hypothetical protein
MIACCPVSWRTGYIYAGTCKIVWRKSYYLYIGYTAPFKVAGVLESLLWLKLSILCIWVPEKVLNGCSRFGFLCDLLLVPPGLQVCVVRYTIYLGYTLFVLNYVDYVLHSLVMKIPNAVWPCYVIDNKLPVMCWTWEYYKDAYLHKLVYIKWGFYESGLVKNRGVLTEK